MEPMAMELAEADGAGSVWCPPFPSAGDGDAGHWHFAIHAGSLGLHGTHEGHQQRFTVPVLRISHG